MRIKYGHTFILDGNHEELISSNRENQRPKGLSHYQVNTISKVYLNTNVILILNVNKN